MLIYTSDNETPKCPLDIYYLKTLTLTLTHPLDLTTLPYTSDNETPKCPVVHCWALGLVFLKLWVSKHARTFICPSHYIHITHYLSTYYISTRPIHNSAKHTLSYEHT